MVDTYLFIVRRHIVLILLLTLLGAFGLSRMLETPATYRSDATIELGANAAEELVRQTPDYGDPERRVATEIEILLSRPVATRAADLLQAQGWAVGADGVTARVQAYARGTSDYIVVSGQDTDPDLAQQLTKAVVSSYLTYRQQLTHDELEQLERELSQQARAAERNLTRVTESSDPGSVSLPARLRAAQLRLQTTTQLLESARLQLSVGSTDVRLLSDAQRPDQPEGGLPPLVINFLAIIAGLLLATGLILVIEAVRDSVRTRSEAERLTSMPVLAELPASATGPDEPAASNTDAAGVRTLRLRLQGILEGEVPRRLLITSLTSDALATVRLAYGFSVASARAGESVLLVTDGLEEVESPAADESAGSAAGQESSGPLIRETAESRVWWCRATSDYEYGEGLLDSVGLHESIESLSSTFGLIIIALSVPSAIEVSPIGRVVDSTVVVVGLGSTHGRPLKRFVEDLRRDAVPVDGLVTIGSARRPRPIWTRTASSTVTDRATSSPSVGTVADSSRTA